MKYLSIKDPPPWSGQKSLSERFIDAILSGVMTLLFFIPRVNRGYEGKLDRLKDWLIEFDEDGHPGREIGLDNLGTPILYGPSERDYGFWLDTDMKYEHFMANAKFSAVAISEPEFEEMWTRAINANPL